METGWMSEPEAEAPAMPLAGMVLATKQREPGDTLAIAAARSRAAEAREAREAEAGARDPDEIAAAMIGRGYAPGMISDLSRRLADVTADLETEREKIARGEKMAAIAQREHAAGRLDVWAVQRMLDRDLGDVQRAGQLERRAASLREQLAEAAAAIAPQRAPEDPLEAASRHANEVFRELTRQRMADAEARRPELRPFAGRGSAAAAAECAGPDCEVCQEGRRRDAARAGEYADEQPCSQHPGPQIARVATPAGNLAAPPGATWGQISDWVSRGWRP